MFNEALLTKLNISSALAEDALFADDETTAAPTVPSSNWEPLPPLPSAPTVESSEHLAAAAQLSDLENELIARTLLSPVQPPVLQHQQSFGQKTATTNEGPYTLPPLFRPPVIDSPPPPPDPVPLRRQNSVMISSSNQAIDQIVSTAAAPPIQPPSRTTFQRMNSVAPMQPQQPQHQVDLPPPYTIGFVSMNDLSTGNHDHDHDHGTDTCIFARLEQQGQQYRASATAATLVRSSVTNSNSEGGGTVGNANKQKRTKKMRRSRNVHPMVHQQQHQQQQQQSDDAGTLASRSASAGSSVDEALYSAIKAQQYGSSPLDTSSDSANAAVASNGVFHISADGKVEANEQKTTTTTSSSGKSSRRLRTGAGPPGSKKMNLQSKTTSTTKSKQSSASSSSAGGGVVRPLSSTSSRISQAKADHFNPSTCDVVNLNHLLLAAPIDETEADAAAEQ